MFTAMLIYWRVAPEKMPSLPQKKKNNSERVGHEDMI